MTSKYKKISTTIKIPPPPPPPPSPPPTSIRRLLWTKSICDASITLEVFYAQGSMLKKWREVVSLSVRVQSLEVRRALASLDLYYFKRQSRQNLGLKYYSLISKYIDLQFLSS